MRYVVAVLVLFAVQASSSEVLGAGASPTAGPRVVFGIDAKAGQRYLQLTERGRPIRPRTSTAMATEAR